MNWFDVDIDPERRAALDATINTRLAERGGAVAYDHEHIGDLLDYGRRAIDEISYDLYNARKFVRMFPDEAEGHGGPFGWVKRLYQRVVRRLLRQQIVFNEAVLGVLEDLDERLKKLEAAHGLTDQTDEKS